MLDNVHMIPEMPPKAEKLPASAFAESSEASGAAPGEHPKEQITNAQEETPQAVAKKPGHKKPGHGVTVEDPPPAAFAEPSEPGNASPGENPKEQITSSQEENPQMIARKAKL